MKKLEHSYWQGVLALARAQADATDHADDRRARWVRDRAYEAKRARERHDELAEFHRGGRS